MNCQNCRTEIEEMELGEPLTERAGEHLASCTPCRAFHEERLSLRRLVGSLEPVSAPPDFDFRLRARLAAAGNGKSPRFWRSLIGTAPAMTLAATFALLVAGVVLYNQFRSGTSENKQASDITSQKSNPKVETPEVGPAIVTAESNPAPEVASPAEKQKTSPAVLTAGGDKQRATTVAGNRNNNRRQQNRPNVDGSPISSNELAATGARHIKPADDLQLASNAIELPVRSTSQPMRVFVNDRSGGRRAVILEPVVFGSQDLTVGGGARLASSQGIW
ncbi:MAG TPA: hypothetical protein VF791_07630 [Pyrinomonadaceae bacterium]